MNPSSTVITVSQLTAAIKNQLESRFPSLAIQGEVSNCTHHSSGHLYFDLKDAGAKIPAVMFRANLSHLPRPLKEGDLVVVKGSLSVYPPYGKYQLMVKSLEYAGVGELLIKLEALKQKLKEKGWFDASRKKPLPSFPQRIGVITSATGAVIRDIINVLSRRSSGFHLILSPVRVQGNEAPAEIVAAIEQFNRYKLADVLIVGRGGGSLEDLWAFNDENVAKAIFESTIPIISAVGHETDITISDFVADVRAPTPSAAAEIVSSEKARHLEFLAKIERSITSTLSHLLKRWKAELDGIIRHPLFSTSMAVIAGPIQRLDEMKARLERTMREQLATRQLSLHALKKEAFALKPTIKLSHFRQRLSHCSKALDQSKSNLMATKKQQLKEIVRSLKGLDPKNVLQRGYSILFSLNEGSVIVSAQDLSPGKQIRALLADGEAKLTVDGSP